MPAAPEIVSTFLASQATSGVKASTLARRTAAIRYAHALKGLDSAARHSSHQLGGQRPLTHRTRHRLLTV